MLQKDPDERITIDEILTKPIMIDHAATHLPEDVFETEFTNYDPYTHNKNDPAPQRPIPVQLKKEVVKPAVTLPVKAREGVYDTSAFYNHGIVSLGAVYCINGCCNMIVKFKENCIEEGKRLDERNLCQCQQLNLLGSSISELETVHLNKLRVLIL